MSRRGMSLLAFVMLGGAFPALGAQKPNPSAKTELVVGNTDFQQLRWIAGRWRGEGEGQPASFERYRFLDDSTLLSETFTDNRFRTVKESSRIELRNHRVTTRGAGGAQWIVTSLDSVSVAFRALAGATNDFIWQRHDSDEWTAVMAWPPTVDHPARTVTYHMKRVNGN